LSLIKKAKGKNGSVAIVAGTKTEKLNTSVKLNLKKQAVIEITLDMANSMKLIAKKCFPKAVQVTDRFHVQN
jgi:transposase